jgi:hypothetical protein
MPKFDRHRIVFGLYLIVLIAATVLIAGHFKLPAWPAFMAMIFFFVEKADIAHGRRRVTGCRFFLQNPAQGGRTPGPTH